MNDPIVPFPKFGAGIGLHRVLAIAESINLDLVAFGARACVVTGSNGKGSVAAMTASILRAAQANVGLFTSPHLFSIRERFALDGEPITLEALAPHWARVLAAARAYERAHPEDRIGGFEFLFLVAASWFSAERCAFTVWEAGIGGRYDPTRLVHTPHAALISLDYEHTAILGKTLEEIAFDKSDACADGGALFLGDVNAEVRRKLAAYCGLRGVRLVDADVRRAEEDIEINLDGAPLRITSPLAGPHQRANAVVAARLAYAMMRSAGVAADRARAAIPAGLAATNWPGRLETISDNPPIVIDVGHTPEGVRLARQGFAAKHPLDVLVCGVSFDKAGEDILSVLTPGFSVIVCAAAAHKGKPTAEVAELARRFNPRAVIVVAETMRDAYREAFYRARAMRGAIYVAGGLFLAIEFKAVHVGLDPAKLRFF